MLQEIQVRQEGGDGQRRWFEGESIELIVWYDRARALAGFQLCYQSDPHDEHALTWRPAVGFSHSRVDDGGTRPDKNMTPILIPNGSVPWDQIRERFAREGTQLDPALRNYVLAAFGSRSG
jgi:hypothetical protein